MIAGDPPEPEGGWNQDIREGRSRGLGLLEAVVAAVEKRRKRQELNRQLIEQRAREAMRGTCGKHVDRIASYLRDKFPEEFANIDPEDDEAITNLTLSLLYRLWRWEK